LVANGAKEIVNLVHEESDIARYRWSVLGTIERSQGFL
jgi:hypothetical protein